MLKCNFISVLDKKKLKTTKANANVYTTHSSKIYIMHALLFIMRSIIKIC